MTMTSRKLTIYAGLAALLAVLLSLLSVFVVAKGAHAATGDKIPVASECNTGWYVNLDEDDLLPTQKEDGFLFDGPSLVHHGTTGLLKTMPQDGAFVATDVTGVKPLFKVETLNPYSTVNKTADGKYWSSKISTGDGSQNAPVNTPGDLVGKGTYSDETTVFSFGVGYANDSGNKALVKSITYAGTTYDLTCVPKPPIDAPKDCEAYVYAGTKTNLCTDFPNVEDINCDDLDYRVALVGKDDPWKLDGNEDGIGCAALPLKKVSSQSPSPSPSRLITQATLPVTGSSTSGIAAGGFAAVAVGVSLLGGLWIMNRRRRLDAGDDA